MEIKLNKLTLENFANFENEEFSFNGKNAKIYGENGTGKTTTANSFTWLLFGKNIEGKTIKNIVPKDIEGNEQLHLTPTVKAELVIDGDDITLERRSEPIKKKDDYGMTVYSNSRTTTTYINGAKTKVTNYAAYIEQIISEDIFKLITNTNEFPRMNWKDKRDILFKISGEVSKDEIIETDSTFDILKDYESESDIENEAERVKTQLKDKKSELNNIPSKIQLLHKQIADIPEKDIQNEINKKETDLDNLREEKLKLENSDTTLEVKREISFKEDDIKRATDKYNEDNKRTIQRFDYELDVYDSDIKNHEKTLLDLEKNREKLKKEIVDKRNEWVKNKEFYNDVNALEFIPSEDNFCECCGQELPADELEAHNEKLHAEHNVKKSEQLEGLNNKLNELATEGKQKSETLKSITKDVQDTESVIEKLNDEVRIKNAQKERVTAAAQAFEDTEEYKTMHNDLKALQDSLSSGSEDNSDKIDELAKMIGNVSDELRALQQQLAQQSMAEGIKEEIKNLKDTEKNLRKEIEELTHKEHVINQYTTAKVRVITERVNNMFALAKFKMFDEQKNGDIKETCEITVDGVSYDDGLNNAMQVNVSLDIIETISKYYNVYSPIFVDNAESVTAMFDTTAQQIKLIVREDEDKLRMEMA